ncbi:30S ribosomal protein S3 [candidate division WWE3 bacterium RIFCSPLOWO2_01_FULL_42_11]|uniref:Small ribosomal subunit protein uS3 n=1 Tax=candidate division WWE3 bacterium RIFCSPLOWO2_01_FULL_42_11 TaxID=1802627 RepID=A0A1F4VRC5_UNCKA|nr:MAG: 30S ribosomal protein S3 [candidate division WWE3 bacterium RIFCSPLOWO2_01_FULL_42_11]
MGQKTHPIGFRLGINQDWRSIWFSDRNYRDFVLSDHKIRKMITKKLERAGLARIDIERSFNDVNIKIHVSKPGVVIGRGGSGIDSLREELAKLIGLKTDVEVLEVADPDLSAELIAQNIAYQIEKRKPFRRVMNFTAEKVMARGAKGVKITMSGLLGGTQIARTETTTLGSISLASLRAQIDYATATAFTQKGTVGIKVWIYVGDAKR